ncbi:MAG: SEC59/DGK1/VTE5 family protein [bacterium]|nr:SEC59/DGK1/VTE5 family protein [bacterium]
MNHLEIRRQVSHILFGITIVILLQFNYLNGFILFDLILLNLIISLLSKRYNIPVVTWLLEALDRTEDIKRFPAKGTLMFLIGVSLVVWMFPKDIALASILILTFGDGVSTYVGTHFGRTKLFFNGMKTCEGSLSGFVAASAGALIFLSVPQALIASGVAMIVEAFEVKIGKWIVNDNITVPLVAAASIWLFRILF